MFPLRLCKDGREGSLCQEKAHKILDPPTGYDLFAELLRPRHLLSDSDGKTLVFRQSGASDGSMDIGIVRLEGDGELEMLFETSFDEHTPKLSPDDRWLAYVSNESGRDEIFVTRFPPSGKWQISTEGGTEPMWSRDGRELFYRNGN